MRQVRVKKIRQRILNLVRQDLLDSDQIKTDTKHLKREWKKDKWKTLNKELELLSSEE